MFTMRVTARKFGSRDVDCQAEDERKLSVTLIRVMSKRWCWVVSLAQLVTRALKMVRSPLVALVKYFGVSDMML